jgi:hypothetical protein
MRSGSINVMCVTFGGFTLLTRFFQLFEVLTAPANEPQAAFNSP